MQRNINRIMLSVPHMGQSEIKYVTDAFKTNWLSTVGPNLSALESEFSNLVGAPSVAVSSGTAGLHLGLRLAGIKADDEVVIQSLTFIGSANPVIYEQAKPIFIDSDRLTWNLDPNLLEEFLKLRARENRLPKAVMVVHLFGQPAAILEILQICHRYGIMLIEDAAESLGSRFNGRHPGTFGDVGVFSFNGNKMITGTTGGMVVSRLSSMVEKVRHWSTQAREPDPDGINNYVHKERGYNYRMSNVVAGIVRGQLEVLPCRVVQRRQVFERYRAALSSIPGFEPQADPPGATSGLEGICVQPNCTFHSRWLSCFLVDEDRFGMSASDLIRWLDAANIESRPVWRPMHLQPLFRNSACIGGSVSEDLNKRGICLPSSSSLSLEEQKYVIDSIIAAHQSSGGHR
jgi:dTDP-4-amino-4,6-dideoxygalactose transaminase